MALVPPIERFFDLGQDSPAVDHWWDQDHWESDESMGEHVLEDESPKVGHIVLILILKGFSLSFRLYKILKSSMKSMEENLASRFYRHVSRSSKTHVGTWDGIFLFLAHIGRRPSYKKE